MIALKIKRTVAGAEKNTVKEKPSPLVMTIGHSTRPLAEFIQLLQAHGVSRVVDVRTVPRSRHNPQFNKESLPGELKKVGLEYIHLPGLGGLRHMKTGSLNVGWRNSCFRSYADYMQTPEFERSLDELVLLAKKERVALMCAEAVGHAYFLSVIVLGRTPQKNRFDPPSPALTHPHPFRSVSPRYARLHSTEWMGMNLQKEVYTPQPEAPSEPKRLPGGEVAKAAELVNYQDGSMVRRQIVKKSTGNVTIFAFDEGQGLSEHTAAFDALVYVLEGEVEITVAGQPHCLHGGEMILMPAQQPHALKALKRFKMILTMIRSEN